MRKKPKQQRSREMVERLLDATATCLSTRGLDGTTTNHVAQEAGVSIGSLYQYFDDKDALVDALLARMGAEMRSSFSRRAEVVGLDQLPLRSVAELGITYGLHRMRTDPLVGEIVRNWSRLPIEKILEPLEGYFLMRAQPYFLENFRDYPIQHLESKLYVLVTSTILACIRYLSDEHRVIPEPRFVSTLADMIVALLEYPAGGTVMASARLQGPSAS